MQIKLPWPPKNLSPNARVHWSKKSSAAKVYRQQCWALAMEAGVQHHDWIGSVDVYIEFYPPDKRRRDDDNLVSSFKSGRDGLANAMGIDDSNFFTHPRLMNETGGYVLVRLAMW